MILKIIYFFHNNLYSNGGIVLFNVRLYRKDELYKKAFFVSLSYPYLPCPCQDILITISIYKFKYMPLNYNSKPFFNNNHEKFKIQQNKITKKIRRYINEQKNSPYKYTNEEILNAAKNPVINHFYPYKIHKGIECNDFTFQWINYAKLTGLYKNIKKKYPIPFNKCEYKIKRNKNDGY